MSRSMVLEMNRTEPSARATFTPPGWLLRGLEARGRVHFRVGHDQVRYAIVLRGVGKSIVELFGAFAMT